jgi:amidase
MAALCQLSASEALALMHNGALSVEDYAKSILSRIKERDPMIKAWVYLNPDLVLAEAKKLDQIPLNKRGPLHGIPIGVKDVILTKGGQSLSLFERTLLRCKKLIFNRYANGI